MNSQHAALLIVFAVALCADGIMDAFGPLPFAIVGGIAVLVAFWLVVKDKYKSKGEENHD